MKRAIPKFPTWDAAKSFGTQRIGTVLRFTLLHQGKITIRQGQQAKSRFGEEQQRSSFSWRDQDFSIVDRTSFAVMRRLGIDRAASLDQHFAVFRFGPKRRQSFTVVR